MRIPNDNIQPQSDLKLCAQLIIQVWLPFPLFSSSPHIFLLLPKSRLLTPARPFLPSLPLSAVLPL